MGSSTPEPADAGTNIPDCSNRRLAGTVELPPAGALSMWNATTDASVDRGYQALVPSLQRLIPSWRCCYTEARTRKDVVAGTLVIEMILTPEGKVKSVAQARGKFDIDDPMLVSCVAATLAEASFPASHRGQASTVTLPLVFRPEEAQ